jgi:hypothetical protein
MMRGARWVVLSLLAARTATAEAPLPTSTRQLINAEVIGGIELAAYSTARFHDPDRKLLLGGQLARVTTIGGFTLRAGTEITLSRGGALEKGTLGADAPVGGVCCKAGGSIVLEASRLHQCVLCRDAVHKGIPLKGSATILLHDTGAPWRGTLSRELTLGGLPLASGSAIELYPDGKLQTGRLRARTRVAGQECAPGVIAFFEGRLARAILATPVRRGQVGLPSGTEVQLDPEGRIVQAMIKAPLRAAGVRLAAASELMFSAEGGVTTLHPSTDVELDGVRFRGGSVTRDVCCDLPGPVRMPFQLAFYSNGRLWSGTLAADQRVRGLPLRRGSVVAFHDDGSLAHGTLARDHVIEGKPKRAGETVAPTSGAYPAPRR